MCAAVVNVSHLRTETANVSWKLRQKPFATEFVKHRQDLLRFSEREDRYEQARLALKSFANRFCQTSLFTRACPASGFCMVASRAFHDQDINPGIWKSRRFHN